MAAIYIVVVLLMQEFNQLFPFESDSFELSEPSYMASPFPHTLEDPTGFVSLDENSTTTCSPLVHMEPSFNNVDSNPQLIPTPPPESASSTPKHRSPTATLSSSPHHSTSTTNSATEYIKGSSLEESPVSSPSSCLGGCGEGFSGQHVIVNNQCKSKNGSCVQVKEESNGSVEEEQHGSSISEQAAVGQLGPELSDDEDKDETCSAEALEMDGDADDQSSTAGSPQAQNIPKNVKLPQSKLVTNVLCKAS